MFKKIISILLIVSMLTLSSCRPIHNDDAEPQESEKEAEVTTVIDTTVIDTTDITAEVPSTTVPIAEETTETEAPIIETGFVDTTPHTNMIVTEITTEPTTEPVTEPATEPATEAATEPVTSAPEPQLDPNMYIGSLYTVGYLNGLDKTLKGYGQGTKMGEGNRPINSTNLQNAYGAYNTAFIAPETSNIYLTFDLGFENGYTNQILDVLKAKDVKAVFFVTTSYCKNNPAIVHRIINEGHALGNHSVSHLSMPTLGLEKMKSEIMGLHEYVLNTFGYTMTLFRPPMGEFSEQSLAVTHSLGYKTVHWSFAYYDYDLENQPEHNYALDKVTGAAHGGAIYLLHGISETNTAILGDVIDTLRGKGYTISLFE